MTNKENIIHPLMNIIKKCSSTLVLKAFTLGFFGILICRSLSAFIMQKLKSLEWFCCPLHIGSVTSALWGLFPDLWGEHGQEETRELTRVQENDGLVPANSTTTDATKTVGETMPCIPPNPGKARALKKSVSINENVEEIIPSKKRNRKIYGLDEEGVKPLKSILKVGSRLREKQFNDNT